jgi:hypothetical protein
VTLNDP